MGLRDAPLMLDAADPTPIDPAAVRWERVVRASYMLRQQFRYEYPGPIRDLRHRLVVAPPPRHGDQIRLSHELTVDPPIRAVWRLDGFGNAVTLFDAPVVEHAVQFDYAAVVERSRGAETLVASEAVDDERLIAPSRLTEPSTELRAAAAEIERGGGNYAVASRVNADVYRRMRYVSGVTSVETTAAEAFAQGTGVCQDYAHIMIAICRLLGIPARYVSGHLLGEGGTHAWVEVLGRQGSSGVAWGFDPTHDRRVALDSVSIAVGRDFADVTPTSGSFDAEYIGRFTTTRSIDVLAIEYAAA